MLLTTDGGPQFGAANSAIKEWAQETGINHDLSAAYSPQSNGEAEAAVKRVKMAIAYSDGTPGSIRSVCHNLNWEQRPDKSGSPAELFMYCSPGLPTIPHKLLDSSDEQRRREEGRSKQVQRLNKVLRKPDIYNDGETVYLRDQEGKWTVRAKVINQRKYQGVETSSYLLRKCKTNRLTVRNKRSICKFQGNFLDTKGNSLDTKGNSKGNPV